MSFFWHIKRLAAMSPEEIRHRCIFWLKKNSWRNSTIRNKRFCINALVKEFTKTAFSIGSVDISCSKVQALLSEANAYLDHCWDFSCLQSVKEPVINWHFDPSTQKQAPLIYSFDINHRNTESIGDAKVIWEKNRLHHLLVMSAAFALTKDEKYASEVSRQVIDWIECNPCLTGINWTHPLELGIRLISWVWCERFLQSSVHYETIFGSRSPLWAIIGQHLEIIFETYSVGSSANNHLIGEMAGLFIASTAFPIYKKSQEWRNFAKNQLEIEIERQTYNSGINKEMAFEYQIFVTEFLLLSLYEAQKSAIKFSDNYHTLINKSLDAIVQLTDVGQSLPRYGDGDDGMAVQLQARGENRATWLLQLGAILLNKPVGHVQKPELPLILLGYDQNTSIKAGSLPNKSVAFKDAGLYLLSSNRNTSREVFVLADAGPLGYLSIAAHGHADALSFTLSAGGKEIFCDPGTYNYYTEAKWRNYFRSTHSHNTVTIDHFDQSKLQGTFLWSRKAVARLEEWRAENKITTLTASHDGYYSKLKCIHKRTITLNDNKIIITDKLLGDNQHQVSIAFHCPPQCDIAEKSVNILRISNDTVHALVTFPPNLVVSIHKGEENIGWYSPRFGIKVPAPVILARTRCTFPTDFTTTIEVFHEC